MIQMLEKAGIAENEELCLNSLFVSHSRRNKRSAPPGRRAKRAMLMREPHGCTPRKAPSTGASEAIGVATLDKSNTVFE